MYEDKCPKVKWLKMKSEAEIEMSQYKISEAETELSEKNVRSEKSFPQNIHGVFETSANAHTQKFMSGQIIAQNKKPTITWVRQRACSKRKLKQTNI